MDWQPAPSDYKQILEQLQSEDIMFVYEGVTQLKQSLALADDQALSGFPLDQYLQKLTELIGQPPIMDISNEIKFMALGSLVILLDIYPGHVANLVNHGIVKGLSETMESSMGFIELSEACIKTFEKISTENPSAVLRSQALTQILSVMDFFDNNTQNRILNLFQNLSFPQTESDFTQHLAPHLGALCQKITIQYEADQARVEKISTILFNIASTFTKVLNPIDSFDKIAALFDKLATLGVVEALVGCLDQYKNYVIATTTKQEQSDLIETKQTASKTYSETTVQNFLVILQLCCVYSHQVVVQLVVSGMVQICEVLLPAVNDKELNSCTEEVLSLLNAMFPSSTTTESEIFLGIKQSISVQTIAGEPDERFKKFQEAKKTVQNEKRKFLQNQGPEFQSFLAFKMLSKLFGLFSLPASSSKIREKCLWILEKLVETIPNEMLESSIDPIQFAQLVRKIFEASDSKSGQQVLATLRMTKQILGRNPVSFLIPFTREGIKQFVDDFAKNSNKFVEPEKADEKPQHRDSAHEFMQMIMGAKSSLSPELAKDEIERLKLQRDKIKEKQDEMNVESKSKGDPFSNKHKQTVLEREHARFSKLIEKLEQLVGEQEPKTEEIKEEEAPKKDVKKSPLISEQIGAEANLMLSDFFNNPEFADKNTNSKIFEHLKEIGQEVQNLAVSDQFDLVKTKNALEKLAEYFTSAEGITSYEFEQSGMLRSLELFLTKSASQAKILVELDKKEQLKNSQEIQLSQAYKNVQQGITSKEAKTLILRLKTFAHIMTTPRNLQLPFKSLVDQCNNLLAKQDSEFFDNSVDSDVIDYNRQAESMREISRQIVINLVFDQEKSFLKNAKKSNDDVEMEIAFDVPLLEKLKSSPFAGLKGSAKDEDQTWIFKKRNKLFKDLDRVLLGIRKCDNIWLLEDFLLKRVRSQQDVKRLAEHNRRSQGGGFFGNFKQMAEQEEHDEKFDCPILDSLFQTLMEELDDFIVESKDADMFHTMVDEKKESYFEICRDVIDDIVESESETNDQKLTLFFRVLKEKTALAIKEQLLTETFEEMEEEEDAFGENMPPEEIILSIIKAKVGEFDSLIDELSARVLEFFKEQMQKKKDDVQMEEVKEEPLQTKVEQQPVPQVKGDDPVEVDENLSKSGASAVQYSVASPSEDVEMTEEALALSGNSEKVEKIEQKKETPKKEAPKKETPFDLQEHKNQIPGLNQAEENFMKQDIEELIRENNGQDIEIEFYHEQKKLALTTSLFEISSTKKPKGGSLSSELSSFLSHLGHGLPFSEAVTIHFCIKDKPKKAIRKESLDMQSYRSRTKSEAVEDISPASLNEIVQQLIDKEFLVFDSQSQKTKNSEAPLKILKVLHFLHKNVELFTQQGIDLLTFEQCATELSSQIFDDFQMIATLKNEIKPSVFMHSKLNQSLVRAIQDPFKLLKGGVSDSLRQVFQNCAFLFSFETKMLYFRLVSFIAIDSILSLNFLKQYMARKGKKQSQQGQPQSHIARMFGGSKDAEKQFRIERQKVTLKRDNLIEGAMNLMEKLQKRCQLEIAFENEEGTGLGPTLEFFSLLSEELKNARDIGGRSIWRQNMPDNSLFPRAVRMPEHKSAQTLAEAQHLCKLFQLAGTFVAKSIMDDRLIDLPISPLMWQLIFGKVSLFNLMAEENELV